MGTNYYLTRIPKEGEAEHKVHIGKSSFGWKFAFQISDTDCLDMGNLDLTRQNAYKVIQDYLDKGYELRDEYGDKVELEWFTDMVDRKTKENEHYEPGELVRDEIVADGARWIYTWFC